MPLLIMQDKTPRDKVIEITPSHFMENLARVEAFHTVLLLHDKRSKFSLLRHRRTLISGNLLVGGDIGIAFL